MGYACIDTSDTLPLFARTVKGNTFFVQTTLLPNQFALHSTLVVISPSSLPFRTLQSLLNGELCFLQEQVRNYVRFAFSLSHRPRPPAPSPSPSPLLTSFTSLHPPSPYHCQLASLPSRVAPCRVYAPASLHPPLPYHTSSSTNTTTTSPSSSMPTARAT